MNPSISDECVNPFQLEAHAPAAAATTTFMFKQRIAVNQKYCPALSHPTTRCCLPAKSYLCAQELGISTQTKTTKALVCLS